MKVGFIGLGNMGSGMAGNLLKKGADLTVFTRTKAKMAPLEAEGAKITDTAAELAQNVDIILTCLVDIETSRRVIFDELLPNTHSQQVIVDHSTVNIETSHRCYDAAKTKGVFFMDAPVSGGPLGAENGTLTIMAGGDDEAFHIVNPFLDMMGENIKHINVSGAGTAMKLVNQLLVGVNTVAAAEAFTLARSANLDIREVAKLLNVSWGNSNMLQRSALVAEKGDFCNSAAPVRNLNKDLAIIKDMADERNLTLSLTTDAYKIFHMMVEQGKHDYDIAGALEVVNGMSDFNSAEGR